MRWPPMPAGAGGLKGVTTNSEHLLFRINKALRQIAARPAIDRRAEKRGVPRPPVLIVGKR